MPGFLYSPRPPSLSLSLSVCFVLSCLSTSQEELAQIEALLDAIKITGPRGQARRDGLLKLAERITAGGPSAACFANDHGARELLLKGLDGAVKRGDEELMDAISAAVAEESRCTDTEQTVELMAVGGSQVRREREREGDEGGGGTGLGCALRLSSIFRTK